MMSTVRLRSAAVLAKERLTAGREKLRIAHDAGTPGIQVCAHLTSLTDGVLLELFESALAELNTEESQRIREGIALVAHGGYGRRDLAPFSDIDLMLLHKPGAEELVAPFARRFTQDIYDTGLDLGFSARSPREASRRALSDATIFTSLAESRLLGGNAQLFSRFMKKFRRDAQRRAVRLIREIDAARREERRKYGETVYLLCPNVKRSRGGLRDIQLVRWVGFARWGESSLDSLVRAGVLSKADQRKLRAAREFLLRLRNEMHFEAGRSCDVLDKDEQVRVARVFGYRGVGDALPVEQFMRVYFERTGDVRYVSSHFTIGAGRRRGLRSVLEAVFSHGVEGDYRVGPASIAATKRGLNRLNGDLDEVLRLMDLANLYDKRIDHDTWEAIREAMSIRRTNELSPAAARRFVSLLSQGAQLGALLRRLHQLRVLEKIIPAMARTRCLMQFNDYHKFTVDEHSLRAVEAAVEFQQRDDLLGAACRAIKQRRLLHLALLLHDLGKGLPGDHSDVGKGIAEEAGPRLRLPREETETVAFLVHKHLLMSHLVQRRDIDDPEVIVQLAVEVGSPDVLQMLYVLTCADLAAVGPGVLTEWKLNLLTILYERTMRQLSGDVSAADEPLSRRRQQVLALRGAVDESWWRSQIASLSAGYLFDHAPDEVAADLARLRELPAGDAAAWSKYLPERDAVQYIVGAFEQTTAGVFHKLTGALTSKGMQILSAEINTLAGGLLLDRFYVHDGDFAGEPPPERTAEVCKSLVASLKEAGEKPPSFRRIWRGGGVAPKEGRSPIRVAIDNSTSESHTIIDVFAHDRVGLLYTITRTLFEQGLSVHLAKIGTYVDQVVDVFYVTGGKGEKVRDAARLDEIKAALLAAIEGPAQPSERDAATV